MKSASAALQAHLAQADTTLVNCWKLKRRDGTVFGATEHDRDLSVDVGDGDGSVVYKAATGYSRSNVQFTHDFKVDNHEITGVLDSLALTEADIRAGRYDGAEVLQFLVNWTDLSMGIIRISRSEVGEIKANGAGFTATLRGLTDRYSQEIVDPITPGCPVDFGDVRCGVRLDPPAWQASTAYTVRPARDAKLGSVVKPSVYNDRHFICTEAGTSDVAEPAWNTTIGGTTAETGGSTVAWEAIQALTIEATVNLVTSRRDFTLTYSGDAPDAFLTGGVVTFGGSSPNAGLSMEVKAWELAGLRLLLFRPMPFAVGIGDSVTVTAGCAKTVAACKTFDNIFGFRGWPHVPGNDRIFQVTG